jgi:tyrosine-protein kinase Etk/Wzc
LQSLDAQIGVLNAQQAVLSHRIDKLPNTEQEALRLLRDVRADTDLYTNLLNSAEQLRVTKAGQVGNVRVVDYAVVAETPVKPKRALVILLAAVLGLLMGTAAAGVRQSLAGGVEHSEQLEQTLGIPVYAVVPHSGEQTRLRRSVYRGRAGQHVLAAMAPDDVAIEGIRSLRTALQFGLHEAPNNIVMIAGPRPEVGKSFLAVNLAAVLASAGMRVLLIDADMRRGDVHGYFGLQCKPGLSEVIGGSDIEACVRHDALPGLDVLPMGTLPSNPAELLMLERFETMLEYFSARYDTVVIDTPPVLAVTDSTVIGKHAGTTLLVVRHGRNPMSELTETVKRLRNGGVTLRGILLCDVPQRGVGYGAYYSGYYGYASRAE